jgi:AraC-like DNA-binding protein
MEVTSSADRAPYALAGPVAGCGNKQNPCASTPSATLSLHLDRPLSVDALADRVAMSARNFARAFARELGLSPGRYLRLLRVEAARRLLEQTDQSLSQVAEASGFRSVDVMRPVLRRALGTTPLRYRRHFQTPAASSPLPAAARSDPLAAARREIARAARVTTTSIRRRVRGVAGRGGAGAPPRGWLWRSP